jgi:hypothetical protein
MLSEMKVEIKYDNKTNDSNNNPKNLRFDDFQKFVNEYKPEEYLLLIFFICKNILTFSN